MTRAAWGSIVGEVRGMLAKRGAVSTWEVRQIHGADPRNGTPDMARANADALRAYRTIGEVRALPFPAPGSVRDSLDRVKP